MQHRFHILISDKIRINIRVLLMLIMVSVTLVCRYNFDARIGYVVFPLEIVLFFVLWLLNMRKGENSIYSDRSLLYVHIAFMVYRIIISAITTGNIYEGAKKILYYELGTFLVFFYAFKLLETEHIIKTLRTIGIINAFLGVYETVTRSSLFLGFIDVKSRLFVINTLGSSAARARTIFMHPIICAVFSTVSWCVLLFYPLKNRWLNTIVRAAIIITIMGTQSRSSWISFAGINALYLIKHIKPQRIILINKNSMIHKALMIFVIMITVYVCRSYLQEAMLAFSKRWLMALDFNNAGNYNRVTMIKMGLSEFVGRDFLSCVFGKGFQSALNLLRHNSIRGWKEAVDNTYVTLLLDYGIIGLSFIVYYITQAFSCALKGGRLRQMCGFSLLSIFISGFFYDLFSWYTTDVLIALMISMLIIKTEDETGKPEKNNEALSCDNYGNSLTASRLEGEKERLAK